MLSAIGGDTPQALMHDACLAISSGDRDVVLVTGAEAMYAPALARRHPDGTRATLVDEAARRDDTPARPFRRGQARRHRPRDEPRRDPAPSTPTPSSRRPPGRQRMDAPRACFPHRSVVVAVQRGGRRQPTCVDPRSAPRRRHRHPGTGQPDGLVPLPRNCHGQHAGGPGCRLHRLLGRGCPRRRRARGTLGLPAGRSGRHTRKSATIRPIRRRGGTSRRRSTADACPGTARVGVRVASSTLLGRTVPASLATQIHR